MSAIYDFIELRRMKNAEVEVGIGKHKGTLTILDRPAEDALKELQNLQLQHEKDLEQMATLNITIDRYAGLANKLARIILDHEVIDDNDKWEAEQVVQDVLRRLP